MSEAIVVVVMAVVILVALFGLGLVAGLRAESQRQRILREQAVSEARIQMATQVTLQRMYDAARQAQSRLP